jgi:formamidopyrimidine-DNA glycosylase
MSIAECVITANQLNETVKGKIITKVTANQNPHTFVWFALEPAYAFCDSYNSSKFAEQYDKYLTGQPIKGTNAGLGGYSAYTFMYVGDRALLFHVLTTLYHGAETKRPKRHQLLLEFNDGTALSFCGSLGGPLFLFDVDENGRAVNYASNFPSILSDDFKYLATVSAFSQ